MFFFYLLFLLSIISLFFFFFFFFNDTATTEIYTLSLHDALPIPVAASIAGLKSNTRYHFRLVATSSAGTKRSGDRSFKTAKPTTTPTFTPNPVVFSHPFTISGQLTGTGAGHATVTLLGRPFPYNTPFAQVGNSIISN